MAKGLGASKVPTRIAEPSDLGALKSARAEPNRPLIPLFVSDSGETERVGNYEVVGVLGRGGMGVVYEVVDQITGSTFALKTIETRFLELPDSNAEHRFKQEISVLERLDHPGIVRLFDSGLARHPMGYNLAFFVMERLEGETLERDIKAGRVFNLGEAFQIIVQLTEALDYLSQNGVLHRDIKPGNIFREASGRIVLMDFGLARSEEFTRLTLAGQIVGTFGYMSPERLCGRQLDISSDVYALGVVLYQMLAGRHPFGAPSPPEMLEAIKRGATAPPSFDALPAAHEVKELVLSTLAYAMDGRPTPLVLRARIHDILDRAQIPASPRLERAQASPALPLADATPPRVVTVSESQGVEAAIAVEATDTGAALVEPTASAIPSVTETKNLGRAPLAPSWASASVFAAGAAFVAFLAGLLVGRSYPTDETPIPLTREVAAAARPSVPSRASEAPSRSTNAHASSGAAPQAPVPEPVRTAPARPAATGAPKAEIVALSPSSFTQAEAAFAHGEDLVEARKFEQAAAILMRALALNPAYADAHRRLGDAHLGLGDRSRAAHHYKTYLALRPGAPDAAAVRATLKALSP